MKRDQLPSMPFFVGDYLASAKVRQMTLAERGAYLELLFYQWQEKTLPKSVPRLARLLGETEESFKPMWETIKDQFVPDEDGGLRNEKLEVVGGSMENTILDLDGVKSLAALPGLDELRGKLVGLISSPATKIAGVLQAPAGQLARVVSARAKQSDAA